MRPVITPAESGRLDEAAPDSVDVLMEHAGNAVALAAVRMGAGYGSRVTVLAGAGNNGGDGYVAARYLAARGARTTVVAFGAPRSGTAAERALRAARAAGVRITSDVEISGRAAHRPDLIVDAVFGVGFHGELPEDVAAWAKLDTPILAVDVPSGLDAGSGEVRGAVLPAERTVTFHALKPGHVLADGPDVCGEVVVADIGLRGGDPLLRVCDEADAPRPVRHRTTHKWSAGSVAVVGGSPGLTGAALLTAQSALHFGAGAVTILCPASLQEIYAGQAPGIMTRGVGSGPRFTGPDADEVVSSAQRFDVMVLGPGLGLGMHDFVDRVVASRDERLLIDADGINALGGPGPLVARSGETVITPHGAELSRVTGEPADLTSATELAHLTGAVVLLKGSPTFVIADRTWAVMSGGPELATIGTGDVLGGMIGALWAHGLDAATATRSAAYWHGVAGAALSRSGAVIATELASEVGRFAFPGTAGG